MNNLSEKTYDTLESIAERKKELLQQIVVQKDAMNRLSRQLVSPLAPAANKANALMRAFNTGMAVFDGIKLGIKLMHKFRRIFRKR